MLNDQFCERLAAAYVGDDVVVTMGTLPRHVDGIADFAGGAFRIVINSENAQRTPGMVPGTLFHEIAHLALGHVPRRERVGGHGFGAPAAKDDALRAIMQRQEVDAQRWADDRLAEFWQRHGDPLQLMWR